jgi:hypothetical protein
MQVNKRNITPVVKVTITTFFPYSDLKHVLGRAMVQVVSRQPLTAEARVRARVNP